MTSILNKLATLCAVSALVACTKTAPDPGEITPPDGGIQSTPCDTTFRYVPPAGQTATVVQVTGEWNNFANPGVAMTGPDATGAFSAQVELPAGLSAYKFIVDGNWILDPAEKYQKYVSGTPNSAVLVASCSAPSLTLANNAVTRMAAGQGHFTATVNFLPADGGPALDPSTVTATMRKDGATTTVAGVTVDAVHSTIALDVPTLADGKYTIFVNAKDTKGGVPAEPIRLVFWVEADAFTWADALIYMVMTDRFKDADPTNNPPPITKAGDGTTITVDPREDYHGGDFKGVTEKINDGTFDKLGISVLWLSPFNTNPPDAWIASDNIHEVSGFHGYWPIKAREVDSRFGTADELRALVYAAHAHGIRVIQDLVVQHVHQEHEYIAAHPDWFNTTGCICGTNNCDWTVHRLDCRFTDYMPNIDWTSPSGAAQWVSDAIWWLDSFDLDGFRLDAVKQVPDLAVINLVSGVRAEFEATGAKVFFTGETAMGWVDDTLADNLSQYQLISQYINPDGLDGQFDFVLYYAVPLNVFASAARNMIHADYWVQASGWEYPQGALMSSYIGSQDTARFISIASYQGQDADHNGGIPFNQWDNIAGPPPNSTIYGEHRLALAWLLSLPGVPMIYYGDEYGEYGGVDPNNRVNWRGDTTTLTSDESLTLQWTRKVGSARKALPAMRRGAYVPVYNTGTDNLLFARQDDAGNVALVAISRALTPTTITTPLPASLGIANGTVFHDHMGGADVTVANGSITVTLGPQDVAILAP